MKKFFSFIAAAVLATTAASAQLYIVGAGDGIDWNPENPLVVNTQADGSYEVTINNLETFKMSLAKGSWDTFNSSCIGINANITNAGTYTLSNYGDNNVLPWKGDWTLKINSELNSITLSTTTAKPSNYTFYIRGDMNGWGTNDAWKFEAVDNDNYILRNVSISATQSFKVADESYGSINFGGVANMKAGVDYTLYTNNNNCNLNEDFTGDVHFNLTTRVIRFGDKAPIKLYLIGDFCSWDHDNSIEMENAEGSNIYTYTFENGLTGGFKITNGTWAYNFGATIDASTPNCVEGDNEAIFNAANNWVIEETTDPVILTFTLAEGSDFQDSSVLSNLNIRIDRESNINDITINNNADAQYYNLQGVRVANPENGIYIVRKGGKTFKTVIR